MGAQYTSIIKYFSVFSILLFIHFRATSQEYSTIEQYKSYFVENSSTIDPIEGIWYVYLNITDEYGFFNNSEFTVAIIKESDSYHQYTIKDGIYKPTPGSKIFYTDISSEYYCIVHDDQYDQTMISSTFSITDKKFGYTIDVTSLYNEMKKELHFKRVIKKYSYSKVYPLSSDLRVK